MGGEGMGRVGMEEEGMEGVQGSGEGFNIFVVW